MDPMTLALIALILASAFVIITVAVLTGAWLKKKIKEKMNEKGTDVITISGDKLAELLSEVSEQSTEVPLGELDMMLVNIDDCDNVEDIEFIDAQEGMDNAAQGFIRQNGDMIRITNRA